MRPVFAVTILVALTASAFALDNNHAVIIQGFLPAEGLPNVSNANELWNDCFLWYELMNNRPSIGGDTDRIHMLWGRGQDFRRTGDWRYDPYTQFDLDHITDDIASGLPVESDNSEAEEPSCHVSLVPMRKVGPARATPARTRQTPAVLAAFTDSS